jgi:ectoine hydroxylase-related dioxygenase (phytanoyl-CoA dioxygenase family)
VLAANSLLALDNFTETNGATLVVPGSHKWESGRRPMRDQAIPLSCPDGSVTCGKSVLDLIRFD